MKSFRNVLAAFTFILAIGAAFASATLDVTAQSRQQVDLNGNLIAGTCQSSSATIACNTTSSNNCNISGWRYFAQPSCVSPFKKP